MNRALDIVTAVIRDDGGRVLVCRKRGAAVFIKPGGKRAPGEDDRTTLARELNEELGVILADAVLLGRFSAPAANEAGVTVNAAVYRATIIGTPAPAAEIEEIAWIDPAAAYDRPLAALLTDYVLPALVLAPLGRSSRAIRLEVSQRRPPRPCTSA